MPNVADYLVSYLGKAGVTHVFGFPGTPLIPILDAFSRQQKIRFVLCRHENAAAMAASAYAKSSGKLAVGLFTSGPGALQAICGVMDAHLDAVPMLVLSGLVTTENQGHWEFQDVDQTIVYSHLSHGSHSCVNARQLPALLRNAIGTAYQRLGATHLALSQDVLYQEIDQNDPVFSLDEHRIPSGYMPPALPAESLTELSKIIGQYKRPVIAVGKRAAGAGPALEALSHKLNAHLVSALDGKGIVSEYHPNYMGVLGIFGFPGVDDAETVIEQADLVLSFGADTLKPFLTNEHDQQLRALVEFEQHPANLSRDYAREAALVGPLNEMAEGLLALVHSSHEGELIHRSPEHISLSDACDDVPLDAFFNALSRYHQGQQRVAVDTGGHAVWLSKYLHMQAGHPLVASTHLGVMGFCLPALIAMQMAHPADKVWGVCGDGGFAMTSAELSTAVEHQLPITLFVVQNGVLHNVRASQTSGYGTAFHNPDIAALASAYGAEGLHVHRLSELEPALALAFAEGRTKPMVVVIHSSEHQTIPMCKWHTRQH